MAPSVPTLLRRLDPEGGGLPLGSVDEAGVEVVNPIPTDIILIHGTKFSASRGSSDGQLEPGSSTGEAWYEDGHSFRKFLLNRLAAQDPDTEFRIVDFDWTGSNSEESRRTAGERLGAVLREREANGVPYHLIAHSHGGSVVWHALVDAKRPLGQLQSWTTVGTPFLTFRPKASLAVYLVGFGGLAWLTAADPLGLRSKAVRGIAPFAERQWIDLKAVFVNAWHGEPGAWGALVVAGLTIVLGLVLAVVVVRMLIGPPLAHLVCALRRGRERRAWKRYGERWHPLVSQHDEAIQGLKCIADPPVQRIFQVPKLCLRHLYLPIRVAALPVQAGFSFVRVATNSVVAPVIDHAVTRRIVDKMHGADIPGLRLQTVSSAPAGERQPRMLTADADDEIRYKSEQGAVRTVTALRAVLTGEGNRPTEGTLGRVAGCLASIELVHTTYFSCLEVRNAITSRISSSKPAELETELDPTRVEHGRPRQWRAGLREWGGRAYAAAAVVLVFAGLHQLWAMLSTPYTQTGMAVHAAAHQPAVGDVIQDGFSELKPGDPERRTARAWLETLSGLGRGSEALADARHLPPASRAWIACVLHRRVYEQDASTAIRCLAALERAFSLTGLEDEHAHVRKFPIEVLESANRGADGESDGDLDHVLGCYKIVNDFAKSMTDPVPGSLASLGQLVDGCTPAARPFAERAAAYAYGRAGLNATPEFFALIGDSLEHCVGAENLDGALLAGLHGLIDRNPKTAATRLGEWVDASEKHLDEASGESSTGSGPSLRCLRALECACLEFHLLEHANHADEDQEAAYADVRKRISDRATELLDEALESASGPASLNKADSPNAAVLARACLISGWAMMKRARLPGVPSDVAKRLRQASVCAGWIAAEHAELANGIRAKAATLCAQSGCPDDALTIAEAIQDTARSEVKQRDIEIIKGLVEADGRRSGRSLLIPRAEAILPEPNPGGSNVAGGQSLVDRVRQSFHGDFMRARIEFAHRLARRVPDSKKRSDLILRIARCAATSELRPLARQIIVEGDARSQAKFWTEALARGGH